MRYLWVIAALVLPALLWAEAVECPANLNRGTLVYATSITPDQNGVFLSGSFKDKKGVMWHLKANWSNLSVPSLKTQLLGNVRRMLQLVRLTKEEESLYQTTCAYQYKLRYDVTLMHQEA